MTYSIERGYGDEISKEFLVRIKNFYSRHPVNADELSPHIWRDLFNYNQRELHDLLLSNRDEELVQYLHRLYDTSVTVGLDWNKEQTESKPDWEQSLETLVLETLKVSGQSIGVERVPNPEQLDGDVFDPVETIRKVEERIDSRISIFPTFGMYGLKVNGAFLHYKTIYALPVFESILRLIPNGWSVLEIGAGIGHLGYLISQKKSISYHCCDIGITSVLHALFAAQNWGHSEIWMDGEPNNGPAKVKFYGPKLPDKKFNLIVNVDSMPEMPIVTASRYAVDIESHLYTGGYFLSMNQESSLRNQIPVRTTMENSGMRCLYRCPSWNRVGYVEECWIKP